MKINNLIILYIMKNIKACKSYNLFIILLSFQLHLNMFN